MLEQCDCTADCGDCPGLKLGTHIPCEFKQKNDRARDRKYKAEALLNQLGYADFLEALETLAKKSH